MSSNRVLWFGPIAAVLLGAGTFAIALIVPGYSHVRQTVSELGAVGSPGQVPFTIVLLLVAACLILAALGIARSLRDSGHSALPACFVIAMALSAAGVGIFAFPHPLHNVFGLSELVGYQAPLIAALTLRKSPSARPIVAFSLAMYGAVVLAIAANMLSLAGSGSLWARVEPYYGIVQRSLFASWFVWCAGFSLFLMRLRQSAAGAEVRQSRLW